MTSSMHKFHLDIITLQEQNQCCVSILSITHNAVKMQQNQCDDKNYFSDHISMQTLTNLIHCAFTAQFPSRWQYQMATANESIINSTTNSSLMSA